MDSRKGSASITKPALAGISSFGIGTLARHTGTKVQTVRYYEEIGLLPEPERSVGGQRRYDKVALDRLAFIRHAREMGFPLAMIRELLDLSDDPARSCEGADAVACRHLEEVNAKLRRLEALKQELERMIAQCRGGRIAECRVIEVLSDHRECLTRRHTDPGSMRA